MTRDPELFEGLPPVGDPKARQLRVLRETQAQYRADPANAQKIEARAVVGRAIQRGEVTRPAVCFECGSGALRIEAHHKDYSAPLEVVWLCSHCHKVEHSRQERSVARQALRDQGQANWLDDQVCETGK